jgi:hypothetical protein
MHDDPQGFRPIDPGRVNSMDPLELDYWSRHLGCTRDQLDAAISAVGEHVTEIREELLRLGVSPR